jgi:DNA-binding PadR family transcriptional regulator
LPEQVPSTDHLIPLREPTFFILLTLSQGSKHGYAILRDVETLSEGRVSLSTGTLYGALGRLLTQGLIQRVVGDTPENSVEGKGYENGDEAYSSVRGRKAYRLTQFGRHVLDAEIGRLQALLSATGHWMGRESL